MSAKQFYHDIDLVGISQLVNARLQNVTNAQMTALAATLTAANTGLVVFNTDQNQQFNWSGSKFDPVAVDLAGDVIFRGVVDATKPLTGQVDNVSGYQYVVGVAGTIPSSLTLAGGAVTVFGDTNLDGLVDVLDSATFTDAEKYDTNLPASWFQGDFNYDGIVDVLDASFFVTTGLYNEGYYNQPPPAFGAGAGGLAFPVAAVPDPTFLAAAGLAGIIELAATRRRRFTPRLTALGLYGSVWPRIQAEGRKASGASR